MFHIYARDLANAHFHDFEIEVDIWQQVNLGNLLGSDQDLGFKVPVYALNTDGIDPSGTNITIERVNITNFDDAVAVKPQNVNDTQSQCSENILIRDCIVHWSVGMTIGSVPANDTYNCVRNVTFQNIVMHHPIKGIYVKTNPGNTTSMLPGSGGEITNIVYDNITIYNPVWWGIYIGP